MRSARLTIALSSLLILSGGCVTLSAREADPAQDGTPPSYPIRPFDSPIRPAPGFPGSGFPAPQLWRVPSLFGSAPLDDEGDLVDVRRYRAPVGATLLVGLPSLGLLERARAAESAGRTTWRFSFGHSPDLVWFQRRSSVDPLPLFESPQIGRLLTGGPRAGALGRVTGLLTSEDGPAFVGAYGFDF